MLLLLQSVFLQLEHENEHILSIYCKYFHILISQIIIYEHLNTIKNTMFFSIASMFYDSMNECIKLPYGQLQIYMMKIMYSLNLIFLIMNQFLVK